MKILNVESLAIPAVKVITFGRFRDHRGYFSEPFRKSDLTNNEHLKAFHKIDFPQSNESFSHKGTVRGLHFQWNPFMGKLVRTLKGRMVDLALDIRKGSPTFGKIIAYDMPHSLNQDSSQWIWVPPGFAHGNYFTEESMIEYFCTSEHSPGCEAGISPLTTDLDWSLCDPVLKAEFENHLQSSDLLISDKDRVAFSIKTWSEDPRSNNFLYDLLQ